MPFDAKWSSATRDQYADVDRSLADRGTMPVVAIAAHRDQASRQIVAASLPRALHKRPASAARSCRSAACACARRPSSILHCTWQVRLR